MFRLPRLSDCRHQPPAPGPARKHGPRACGSSCRFRRAAERTSRPPVRRTSVGQEPVVVENRPGADGIVGVTGCQFATITLLFSHAGPISINPLIHASLPYDPDRDLVPIASAIMTPLRFRAL